MISFDDVAMAGAIAVMVVLVVVAMGWGSWAQQGRWVAWVMRSVWWHATSGVAASKQRWPTCMRGQW